MSSISSAADNSVFITIEESVTLIPVDFRSVSEAAAAFSEASDREPLLHESMIEERVAATWPTEEPAPFCKASMRAFAAGSVLNKVGACKVRLCRPGSCVRSGIAASNKIVEEEVTCEQPLSVHAVVG